MENILEVNNLSKNFYDFSLKNVSFNLPKGYIMGFIGPNGAGKSTTIKLILNLLKKDSGDVKIFGLDNINEETTIKNKIGFVFDESPFYRELTLKEIAKVISPFYKDWNNKIFNSYIEQFELPLKKKINDYSKGMKMKLSLAIAMSHHADLLIMDEPTSGLDPLVRNEFLEILSQIIQDENKSVFFSTHITSDLDKIADYITFIDNGEIVMNDTKDNILDNYGLVKGEKKLLDKDTKNFFIGVKENQFGFEGLVADRHSLDSQLRDSLLITKPSLEDIMLYTVRRSSNV